MLQSKNEFMKKFEDRLEKDLPVFIQNYMAYINDKIFNYMCFYIFVGTTNMESFLQSKEYIPLDYLKILIDKAEPFIKDQIKSRQWELLSFAKQTDGCVWIKISNPLVKKV